MLEMVIAVAVVNVLVTAWYGWKFILFLIFGEDEQNDDKDIY